MTTAAAVAEEPTTPAQACTRQVSAALAIGAEGQRALRSHQHREDQEDGRGKKRDLRRPRARAFGAPHREPYARARARPGRRGGRPSSLTCCSSRESRARRLPARPPAARRAGALSGLCRQCRRRKCRAASCVYEHSGTSATVGNLRRLPHARERYLHARRTRSQQRAECLPQPPAASSRSVGRKEAYRTNEGFIGTGSPQSGSADRH